MIKYKLTDQNMQTYHGFQWEIGKWVETNGAGGLCGPGWLHFYDDPLLAVLHNPIHADIQNPRLFEAEVTGEHLDDNRGLKCGYTKARLVKEIPLPTITLTQKIAYGILCSKKVYKDEKWNLWADKWLSNKDRSKNAAISAAPAFNTTSSAYNAAASVCNATISPDAAAYVASYAAAYAAEDAYDALDLVEIAKEAMKYQ